jgi:hypothetical protein
VVPALRLPAAVLSIRCDSGHDLCLPRHQGNPGAQITMPSGYERSPDYGGPEPTWRGIAAIVLVILALGALIILALSR